MDLAGAHIEQVVGKVLAMFKDSDASVELGLGGLLLVLAESLDVVD